MCVCHQLKKFNHNKTIHETYNFNILLNNINNNNNNNIA